MKLLKIFLLLFFITEVVYSQDIEIQEIKVSDSILSKVIKKYIEDRKITEKRVRFVNKGYIEVDMLSFNHHAIKDELKISYRIMNQNHTLGESYPLFYSYLDGKLIFFNTLSVNEMAALDFSKRSKKRLSRKLEPYLNKREHIKARDSTGKIVINDRNFRDEYYNLHGGIILEIYANGTYLVKRNH